MDERRSLPSATKHVSVARVPAAWYPLAWSRELADRPLARTLYGTPLVVFRGEGGAPAALLDRCAHRNVPLSLGCTVRGGIECAYHGWQFSPAGCVTHVPGLCVAPPDKRLVPSFATREKDGLVFVYGVPDVVPSSEPYAPSPLGAGYTTVTRAVDAQGSLHATLENALDVPHTAFVHRGLFRGATPQKHRIKAVVTRSADRVVTEYVGEPRPSGLIGRILSPSGGVVVHHDRFIMPSIAEVEYRIGTENHILVTAYGLPVDDFETRLFAVVRFKLRLPGWLVRPLLEPIALRIFAQDARILAAETAAIARFDGEHFMSTELDLMGPQMWTLLRRAERGTEVAADEPPFVREIELEV